MDKVLAYLKSVPHDLKLLSKSLEGVEKTLPKYNSYKKESEELSVSAYEELVRAINRNNDVMPHTAWSVAY